MRMKIIIKNIVCSRCIKVVRSIFEANDFEVIDVKLGYVIIKEILSKSQKESIKKELLKDDFEWIDDPKESLVAEIKALVIEQIYYQTAPLNVNFSDYLIKKLKFSYAHLSRVFSSVEKQTIGSFIISQKIERAKELLLYGELSLSEIADLLHYSSVGQLSNQFKKIVGCSPTDYKKEGRHRTPLDKL